MNLTGYWINFASDDPPFGDNEFVSGKGYAITFDNYAVFFMGSIVTEAVNVPVTYTADQGQGKEGFNLVGNPYPSYIAITDNAMAENFLEDNADILNDSYQAIYLWDEQSDWSTGDDGDYITICNTPFTGFTGGQGKAPGDDVQPGQAFMVRVKESGNIVFNPDTRMHGGGHFYKAKQSWPGMQLIVQGNNTGNSTIIAFNDKMTKGLDPSYDVAKMKGNSKLAIYTRLLQDNNEDYAIQALPKESCLENPISVGIDAIQEGYYTFSVYQEQLAQYAILLEDRDRGVFVNLKDENYTTEIKDKGTGRFYLHLKETLNVNQFDNQLSSFISNNDLYLYNPSGKSAEVSIYNLDGQKVALFYASGEEREQFDLKLSTGIYVLNIQNNSYSQSKKVFIP